MAGYSGLELQTAIYNKLTGDATLQTALGASGSDKKVYDTVPQGSNFPYIIIGDETGVDWSTKTDHGMEITVTIHAFTRGRARSECKALVGHLHRLLHQQDLSLSTNTQITLDIEFEQCFAEEGDSITGQAGTKDLITYHGVARFRALTEEI